MAEAQKQKRERVIDRSYDDKAGKVELNVGDDVLAVVEVSDVKPELLVALAIRKIGEVVSAAYTNARKAEGGTHEKGMEAAQAAVAAMADGSLTLRQGAGEGLSIDEEKLLVAKATVELGYFEDISAASAKVEELYAQTETRKMKKKDGTEKSYEAHPAYNQLKRDKDIAAYIAKASGEDTSSKTKALLGK